MNDEQIFLDESTGDDAFSVSIMCEVCSLEEIQQEGSKGNNKQQKFFVKSVDTLWDLVKSG